MFNFIKNTLKKIYTTCTSKLDMLFSRGTIDQETLNQLERILIEADTGVATTKKIIHTLKEKQKAGAIPDGSALKQALHDELISLLSTVHEPQEGPVTLLVGINGSGKTTLAAKLAYQEHRQGKRVLLVAADTFRAAAQEQLAAWAEKLNIDIVLGKQNQDPASVVFAGCQKYKQEGYQALIIDTAGRLQTKINLMKELEKMKRIINQQLPNNFIKTILTVDSMLGQNSLEQARIFHESTKLDGIALTKMDGTGKGGIVFAIAHELGIPVIFISFGEAVDQLKLFDAAEYVQDLMSVQ
jgi:fused signal recognition particle receptor